MADIFSDADVMGHGGSSAEGPRPLSDAEVMGGEHLESAGKEVPLAARPLVGANRAIASMAGAPVDAATWVINHSPGTLAVNKGAEALGYKAPIPEIHDPVGGSESIKRAMGVVGANPDDVRPAHTTAEKYLEAGGEGAAGMLVPGLGAEAIASRAGAKGAGLVVDALRGGGAASNAAVGTTSGVGAKLGEDTAPEPLKPVAGLVGGLLGGGVGAAATTALDRTMMAATDWASRLFEAPQLTAARQIEARATDPQKVRMSLREATEAPPLVEGSEPTTFQATGDLGIGALERETAASPTGVAPFAERRVDQNTARLEALDNLQKALPEDADPSAVADLVRGRSQEIEQSGLENVTQTRQRMLDEIEKLKPEGDPKAVTNYVRQQVDGLENTYDQRVTAARKQLDDAFKGGQLNEAEYGAALREAPLRLRSQIEKTEREVWDAVDPDRVAPFDPKNLKGDVDAIEKAIPRTAEPPEGKEAALFDVILGPQHKGPDGQIMREGGLDDATTFGEITALRSRLTERLRDQTNTPTVDRRLTLMLKAVDNSLAESGTTSPEVLDRYAAARDVTKDKYDRFGSGNVGAILKEGDRDGFKMTASNVAKNIFDRPEDLRTYISSVGDDTQARSSLRDYAAFSLRKAAVRDGMLSPENYQKWAANHEYVLREFPELRQQFGNMRAAQTSLDESIAAQKGALSEYQSGALARILQDEDPTKAIGKALNDPTEFNAIVDRAKSDPEALAGLKRATMDHMLNRSIGTATGSPQVSIPSLEKFYLQNKAPLDRLFGNDLAEKLAGARNAQTSLDGALNVQKQALNAYQTGAIKRLIGAQDPAQVIANALKRPGEFAALAAHVGDDPAATAGLKRAVVDYMMSKALSTAESGTSGNPQINSATLQKFYLQNRSALASLFDRDELGNIERITADLQRANRSTAAVRIPGGSNTAQDLGPGIKSVLQSVMKQHGGKAMGGTMGGPVGFVAGAALDALRSARMDRIDKAVTEMMLDPKMAAIWLAKVPQKSGESAAADFIRRTRAVVANQIMNAVEQEKQSSESSATSR